MPETELLPRPVRPITPEKHTENPEIKLERPNLVAQKITNERSSKLENTILFVLKSKKEKGEIVDDNLVIRVLSRFDLVAISIEDRQELVKRLKIDYNLQISENLLIAEKLPTLTKENKNEGKLNQSKTIIWNGQITELEGKGINQNVLIEFNNSLAGFGISLSDLEFRNKVRKVILVENNKINSEISKLKNTDLRGVMAIVKKLIMENLLQKQLESVYEGYKKGQNTNVIDNYFLSLSAQKENSNTEIYKKMMEESLELGYNLIDFSKNLAGKLALRELFNR